MNKYITAFTLLITLGFNLTAQNDTVPLTETQKKTAEKIAVQWFTLLMNGNDIDPLLKISKTPFFADNNNILDSTEELTTFYNKVVTNKGKRVVPEITNQLINKKEIIAKNQLPHNTITIEITALEGELKNNKVYVFIEISENTYKVIGFMDG